MRSSSDSIAHLAGALAKAQLELVNPPKTLTAFMDEGRSGRTGRDVAQSYRYAPLSAGLEIVRKTLCKHDLAVIQTTHVVRDSATVLLTTTLAHGSGEWISAHWPVCRASDMAQPKLMGAALTYARRYGLFTLVGFAGEDDLDAPELAAGDADPALAGEPTLADPAPAPISAEPDAEKPSPGFDIASEIHTAQEGVQRDLLDLSAEGRGGRRPRSPRERLRPARLRHPLRDLAQVQNPEALFRWALEVLPVRNKLADEPRAALDAAFLAKADAVGTDPELLIAFGSPAMLEKLDAPGREAQP